jgi:predicted CopG family antitoxin
MIANKRIPVRENTWRELSDIKEAGQTYDMLLQKLIEKEKKARLMRDIKRIKRTEKLWDLNEL